MTTTYAVAVKEGSSLVFALDGSGERWSDRPVYTLDMTARDGAVQAAEAASLPYQVIERLRAPLGTTPAWVDRHVAGVDLGLSTHA